MVKGIDRLIICSPYEAPTQYYQYDSDQNIYHKRDGRRPSGYQSMNENGVYGMHHEIKNVNRIRRLVDEWRDNNYPGTTKTTRTLLYHWRYREENQLFFCQIEAIETIIYATEHQEIIDKIIQEDDGPFKRYCTKMATGTGKTIVMGMLIALQALNAGSNYTRNILVVTPNLTVKDRLQVLKPGDANNIYDEFDLVPKSMRSALGGIHITITNFQQLTPKQASVRSVAKLGKQGPKSFAASIVGRGTSKLLVINDEGHHAWRPSRYTNTNRKDAENAGMWTSGLDMIHDACNVLCCHDFSATPFVPTGKNATEEALFGWIISDFSLSDAIESGLVKTPRTPESGDRFYHLYQNNDVRRQLNEHNTSRLPDLVEKAYKLLEQEWRETYTKWREYGRPTPPVMITVCNSTKHAKLVVTQFEKNAMGLNKDLVKSDSLLHIDSEAIKAIETEKGRVQIRDKVSTVGKVDKSGQHICNIVSVDMLTEGWDARTVTHIMGLRAFKSQLLCEQVVGRGLRRTSYDVNEDGLFDPEHVDILGVPFAGILSEDESTTKGGTVTIPIDIYTTKPEHHIAWPIVTDIRETLSYHTDIDWSRIEQPQFDRTPNSSVSLGPLVDGWTINNDNAIQLSSRKQTIIYTILQNIMENYRRLKIESISEYSPYNSNQQQTTIDTLEIIRQYIQRFVDSARLDDAGRISLLFEYRDSVARDIFHNIVIPKPDSKPEAVIAGTASTDILRKSTTKKRKRKTKKTHLNIMTADSDLELQIGKILDTERHVISWAKSDMVGFSVPYTYKGSERSYRPDFIVHLDTGVQLVIEGKGKEDDKDKAKKNAIKRWAEAINLNGRYGVWDSVTIYGDQDIRTSIYDAIKLTSDKRYTQTCQRCTVSTETLPDAVKEFGLEKSHGILRVQQLCRQCRNITK